MNALLKIENVQYRYAKHVVLDGINLDVSKDEVLGLLGRNGSGKSTLLSVLIGMHPLQTGKIFFEGSPISPLDPHYRNRFGVVFQRPSLDQKLSVLENLQLTAKLRAIAPAIARTRITDSIELAGLESWAHSAVGKLSGGMKRRLDIARALLHEPELLFMDEPTAGLDEVAFRETWDAIANLRKKRGFTIFMVTHRPDEAEKCDRLALLAGGKIVLTETPAMLRSRVEPDLVVLTSAELDHLEKKLSAEMGLTTRQTRNEIHVECKNGHLLIPKLVDALGSQLISSVSLRHASMGDVFFKLTGTNLLTAERAE